MFREIIIKKLQETGIKRSVLSDDLGIGRCEVSSYLKSGKKLSVEKIEKIFEYLKIECK